MISDVNYDNHSWKINNYGILKSTGIYNPQTIFTSSIQSFYMRSFIYITRNPKAHLSFQNTTTPSKRPLKRLSNSSNKKLKQEVSSTSSSLGESSKLLLPSSSSGMTTRSSSSSSSSVSEVTTQLSEVSFNSQCDEVTKLILNGRLITNLKKVYLVSNLTVSIQYDTYIQRIIINDNEDDNYYKKTY